MTTGSQAKVDPITTQVIRYALEQIADEMGRAMVRTARSTIIKEIEDISCAVFDARGHTVAQAHHAPMLLTGFEITMQHVLQEFPPEALAPGDIIASNDPYRGGQHIMDIQTFAPVFVEGKLVGWVATIAHHQDMGGAAPGGVAGGMTEVYAEGLRLPMVKLYRAGRENADVWKIFGANIRVPEKTFGDVRAQASSCFVGVQRMEALFAKYGAETVHGAMQAILDTSERRIRQALAAMPDGDYTGVDFIDDDGRGNGPIKIQVNVRKRGDSAVVDFQGTDRQVPGNTNCPLATTHAAVYYAMIAVTDPDVPPNSGCYFPVRIEAQPGLVVNPLPPAAVASRTNCSQKVVEAMMRAFADAFPDRVMAGSHGQITTCGFSGFDPVTGRRWVYTDIQGGGAGARPVKDARDGQDSHLARFLNTPIEAAELEYPLRIEQYGFVPDSGGAGEYRGGLGLVRDIRFLRGNVSFARYSDRHKIAAFGLFGGREGGKGAIWKNPGTPGEERLDSKGLDYLAEGDLVRLVLPGGGGYGRPEERDPEAVLADVRDGKVSLAAAREIYKVIIDPADWTVDAAATAALRAGGLPPACG